MIDNLNSCNFTSKEQAGAAASKRLSLGETGMGNSDIVLCSLLLFSESYKEGIFLDYKTINANKKNNETKAQL